MVQINGVAGTGGDLTKMQFRAVNKDLIKKHSL